jgi:hypothetical protein
MFGAGLHAGEAHRTLISRPSPRFHDLAIEMPGRVSEHGQHHGEAEEDEAGMATCEALRGREVLESPECAM